MGSEAKADPEAPPEWFGSAARDIAFFPVAMSGYAVFYAVWWPFAWGWTGGAALALVVVAAGFLVVRGVAQIRHAAQFPDTPTPEIVRERRAMLLLNSVTHPVWMLGAVVLLVLGHGRWALPLMVFVIGAHFIPMARILHRRIDYVLGPITMVAAIVAGMIAFDTQVSWLVVFSVAGIGGAGATLCYALYLAREYRRICERARTPFPVTGATAATREGSRRARFRSVP